MVVELRGKHDHRIRIAIGERWWVGQRRSDGRGGIRDQRGIGRCIVRGIGRIGRIERRCGGSEVTIVDASTPREGGVVTFDASDCNCLPVTIRWGREGGRVLYTDTSQVSPCKTYSHERDNMANAPPITCSQELMACGSNSIGIGDVTAALRNSDVQQAIRAAPILYGADPRAYDGALLRVVIAGAVIEIGAACPAAASGCKAIPPGVAELGQLLESLDMEELGRPPCSTTFRPR